MSDTPTSAASPEAPVPAPELPAPDSVHGPTPGAEAAVEAAVDADTDTDTDAAGGQEAAAGPVEGAKPGAESKAGGPANLSPAAVAALLAERFPALFGAGRALPIKLRIQADIQQRAPGLFNKKSLSIFLHRYTTSTAYLKALAGAPQRLDLDGAPAGEVDAVHREAAAVEVERRKQMFEERRAAEREVQRQAAQEQRRAQAAQAAQQGALQAARHAAQHSAEAEARRGRAALLRAFETSTLTKTNFCALKGIVEAELDAQLGLARQEREQRPAEAPRDQRPPQGPRPGPGVPRQERGGGGGGGGSGGGGGGGRPAGGPRGPRPERGGERGGEGRAERGAGRPGKPPLKPAR